MASGDLINYANFRSMHGVSWDAVSSSSERVNGNQTIFICGISFCVGMYINSAWLWDGITVDWTVSYYNGSSWVTVLNERKSTDGVNRGYWTYFYHNRSAEGTSSQDRPNYHLWKVTLTRVSSTGDCSHRIHVWVGGIATMTRTEYENVRKNSNGVLRLIKGYRPGYWRQGGTYGSDGAFLAGEAPQSKAGTPISTTTGTYKWIGAGDY